MKSPYYFGGMILSNIDAAYAYENWLKEMLHSRYIKYSKNWELLIGMDSMFRDRKYARVFLHPMPEDPLIYFPEKIIMHPCLFLHRSKLKLLKLVALKFRSKKGYYQTATWR